MTQNGKQCPVYQIEKGLYGRLGETVVRDAVKKRRVLIVAS